MSDVISKVELDDNLYDVTSIVDKTLVAARDIPVYKLPPDKYDAKPKPFGIVKKGQPVGVVYSWLNPDTANNRSTVWWQFWPATGYAGVYFYAKHDKDDFDLSALRQQGVISVQEKIEEEKKKEEEANKTWYDKLLDKAIPVVLTLGIGVAVINVLGRVITSKMNKKSE